MTKTSTVNTMLFACGRRLRQFETKIESSNIVHVSYRLTRLESSQPLTTWFYNFWKIHVSPFASLSLSPSVPVVPNEQKHQPMWREALGGQLN